MPSNADNVLLTFPPRPISQWERTVLADWFTATRRAKLDVAAAYVSERRGDDPMIVWRIVVVTRPDNGPSHLIYSPAESTFWVVSAAPAWGDLMRFRSLRDALNSIRPVLEVDDATRRSELTEVPVW